MEWKGFSLGLLVVFLLPGVLGASLTDAELLYNDVHPVKTLGPQPLPGVTFKFSLSGPELERCELLSRSCVVTTDLTNFSSYKQNFELNTCSFNATAKQFTCKIKNLQIFSRGNDLEYKVSVFIPSATPPAVLKQTGTFPILYDTTIPVLTKLETSYCNDGTCYVGSNARTSVKATFEDDPSSFDYKRVLFSVNTQGNRFNTAKSHAQTCTGLTCETTFLETPTCSEGSLVHVTVSDFAVSMPSSEDALNAVDNSYSITAICDATNPEVTSLEIRSGGPFAAIFDTAHPLLFSAIVLESAGRPVRVRASSETLLEEDYVTECSETDPGVYVCDDRLANLLPGDHRITFTFEDAVGNQHAETRDITILESAEKPDLDLVTLRVQDITPERMNRVALQLAVENGLHYPFLIDYTLQAGSDVRVVGQSLDNMDCVWDEVPLTEDSNRHDLFSRERSYILKPNARANEQNRFVMDVHTAAGALPNKIYARCEYDIFLAEGNRFYTTPERESFNLELNFFNSVLGTPGEAFVAEIKRAENDIDTGTGKAIESLNKIGGYADTFCGGYYTLSGLDGVATALQTSNVPFVAQFGDVVNAIVEPVFSLMSDDYQHAKNRRTLWSKNNPEGVPAASFGQQYALLPKEFSIQGMCEWWTCADAKDSDGFLGSNDLTSGLTCSNINGWLSGEHNFDGSPITGNVISGDAVLPPLEEPRQLPENYDYYVPNPGELKTDSSLNPFGPTYDSDGNRASYSLTDGEYCAPKYENSLLTSLGLTGTGFCAKGVLYNLGKWHGIDCGYVSCLKEQSLLGANINVCKQARDFKQCTAVFDEIFELPIINVVSRTSSLVNANVQDAGFNLFNTGIDAWCNPQRSAADAIAEELIKTSLDVATSGGYSAYSEAMALISRFTKVVKIVPKIDAVTKATPTTGNYQRLVCNIKDSIMRFSEVSRLTQGGLSFQSADYADLCTDARCNGNQCVRHGIEDSYLDGLAGYGLLIRGSAPADETAASGEAAAVNRAYYNAYKQAYDDAVDAEISGLESEEKRDFQAAMDSLLRSTPAGDSPSTAAYTNVAEEYNVDPALLVRTYEEVKDLPDRVVLVKGDEWFATIGDVEGTPGADSPVIEVRISKKTAEFLDEYYGDRPLNYEEVQKLNQAIAKCTQDCTPERIQTMAADEIPEQGVPTEAFATGLQEGIAKQALDILDGDFSSQKEIDKANENIQQTCEQKKMHCSIDGGVLRICEDEAKTICKTFNKDELRLYSTRDEAMGALVRIGIDFGTKWLYDQGYLDALKLSNWGDWGARQAATAEKLWSPEEWKTNLCSGEVDILIDDDPLLGLGRSQGPVLTFAAEKRALDESNIYTVSYFIRTGDPNSVRLQIDGLSINLTSDDWREGNGAYFLEENGQMSGGLAFEDEKDFRQFCIVFADEFPDVSGKTRFCREVVEDAYER